MLFSCRHCAYTFLNLSAICSTNPNPYIPSLSPYLDLYNACRFPCIPILPFRLQLLTTVTVRASAHDLRLIVLRFRHLMILALDLPSGVIHPHTYPTAISHPQSRACLY